ncbi:hypothetical protein ACFLYN_04890 [Chloroflexota bacterium]
MIVECSQCGDRKYLPEPIPYGKKFMCKSCRTILVLADESEALETPKRNSMTIAIHQALIVLVSAFLVLSVMGSSTAAAKSASRPQTPLEGIIAVLSGDPMDPLTLLDNVQEVVAQYERSVVSESLQAMRVLERVREVTPVTVPTNNMAFFPSSQNPLFPEYLNWKYSQFEYTVDEYGIINIANASSPDTACR